jgi:AAHS family 4-hydroxybenzoate transporter-like MFS transporter
VLAALAIAGISTAGQSVAAVMVAIGFSGLFVIGSQFGMNALAAAFYPTSMRVTGIGWALGIGRIGSILGPVIGGIVLARGWDVRDVLMLAALPSAVAAVAVGMLWLTRSKAASHDPQPPITGVATR